MPPPPGTAAKKKKKGRRPAHQNAFAFRHNPKSKKTDRILASPNVGVCRRCHDKIEWRKRYRKYKPRTQPGKCNICGKRNVYAAYHTICADCTTSDEAIAAMERAMEKALGAMREKNAAAGPAEEAEDGARAGEDVGAGDRKGKVRVCAVCGTEPASSKHDDASGEGGEIAAKIAKLEEALETNTHVSEGRRLNLREKKSYERRIERLREDLKEQRREARREAREGGNAEGEEAGDAAAEADEEPDTESEPEPEDDEEEDPFLAATGGKALVGEEYQKMLLARQCPAQS